MLHVITQAVSQPDCDYVKRPLLDDSASLLLQVAQVSVMM